MWLVFAHSKDRIATYGGVLLYFPGGIFKFCVFLLLPIYLGVVPISSDLFSTIFCCYFFCCFCFCFLLFFYRIYCLCLFSVWWWHLVSGLIIIVCCSTLKNVANNNFPFSFHTRCAKTKFWLRYCLFIYSFTTVSVSVRMVLCNENSVHRGQQLWISQAQLNYLMHHWPPCQPSITIRTDVCWFLSHFAFHLHTHLHTEHKAGVAWVGEIKPHGQAIKCCQFQRSERETESLTW